MKKMIKIKIKIKIKKVLKLMALRHGDAEQKSQILGLFKGKKKLANASFLGKKKLGGVLLSHTLVYSTIGDEGLNF